MLGFMMLQGIFIGAHKSNKVYVGALMSNKVYICDLILSNNIMWNKFSIHEMF